MKGTTLAKMLVLGLVLVVCRAGLSQAAPMGTAFTYQGRLIDANNAADGLYDFQFKLYDANVAGTQKGNAIDVNEVDVIDGYCTVLLDFGSDVFNGNDRWLEIGVRAGELKDPNAYTVLIPRQRVTPTPYALYAAFTSETDPTVDLGKLQGLVSNDFHNLGGVDQVGITAESDPQVGGNTTNYIPKWNGSALVSGTIYDSGNVGIGTTSPSAKLYVNGDIGTASVYKIGAATVLSVSEPNNTFVGSGAGASNTTGQGNTFSGYRAGYSNTTGWFNTFSGYQAGLSNTTGNSNTFSGNYAGCSNTKGYQNIFSGYQAGYSNTTGFYNTFVGTYAGENCVTGCGNVFIGYAAGFNETGSNKLYIANWTGTPLIYGDFATGKVGIGTTSPTSLLTVYKTGANDPIASFGGTGSNSITIQGPTALSAFVSSGSGNFMPDTVSGDAGVRYHQKLFFGDGNNSDIVFDTIGRVGIGTTNPGAKLEVAGQVKVTGGSPEAGKVLTSDATGLASWQTPYTGDTDWIISGTNMYSGVSGKIGIGTTSPGATLDIKSGVSSDNLRIGDNGSATTYFKIGRNTTTGYLDFTAMQGAYGYTFMSGNVGIGTTTPGAKLEVNVSGSGNIFKLDRTDGGGWLTVSFNYGDAKFDSDDGYTFSIDGSQKVTFDDYGRVGIGVTSPSYQLELPDIADIGGWGLANAWKTYSSRRWKTNIQPIEDALQKVQGLRGVYFNWKSNGKHDIGLIAEEVAEVIPEVVGYEEDSENAMSLDYSRLVALLVEAVKAQQAKIDALESALEKQKSLEERIAAIEARIQLQAIAKEAQQ